jgi:hypothetical protein
MRRLFAISTVIGLMTIVLAQAAAATPGDTTTCQAGSDSGRATAWVEIDGAEELADFIHPDDPAFLPRAMAIIAFNDHNRDGKVCVMTQYLPNANSGSDTWFQIEDNHYDPPQRNR